MLVVEHHKDSSELEGRELVEEDSSFNQEPSTSKSMTQKSSDFWQTQRKLKEKEREQHKACQTMLQWLFYVDASKFNKQNRACK